MQPPERESGITNLYIMTCVTVIRPQPRRLQDRKKYGGPAVTAGGLLFIGATKDEKFRAFNKSTGELLWETDLPAGGYATPSVYEADGKQYIVIAAGGGKMGTKSGDAYIAFSLPDEVLN